MISGRPFCKVRKSADIRPAMADGGGGAVGGGGGSGGGADGGGDGRFPRRAVKNRIIMIDGHAVRPGINHVSMGQVTCHERDITQYLN